MAKYTSLLKLAQQFDIVELHTEIKTQFRQLYPPSFKQVCNLKCVPLAHLHNRPRPLQLFLLVHECNLVEVLHEAHNDLLGSAV